MELFNQLLELQEKIIALANTSEEEKKHEDDPSGQEKWADVGEDGSY